MVLASPGEGTMLTFTFVWCQGLGLERVGWGFSSNIRKPPSSWIRKGDLSVIVGWWDTCPILWMSPDLFVDCVPSAVGDIISCHVQFCCKSPTLVTCNLPCQKDTTLAQVGSYSILFSRRKLHLGTKNFKVRFGSLRNNRGHLAGSCFLLFQTIGDNMMPTDLNGFDGLNKSQP